MGCQNCEDRWRLVLAQQSNIYNMKDKDKQSEKFEGTEESSNSLPKYENPPVIPQATVPPLVKPDINKVIEERRKALQGGKVINK